MGDKGKCGTTAERKASVAPYRFSASSSVDLDDIRALARVSATYNIQQLPRYMTNMKTVPHQAKMETKAMGWPSIKIFGSHQRYQQLVVNFNVNSFANDV